MKEVQLGTAGPPGQHEGEPGWRVIPRVLRSCVIATGWAAADLANVFSPSDCRCCGAPMVTLGSYKIRICEECVFRLEAQADASHGVLCERCGDSLGMESARFAAAMGVHECTMCRMAPPEFDRAVAFADYDHEMREMLHLLKFDGMRGVARHILANGMASAVRKVRSEAAAELLVVPVPLFAARQRKRGFNQAQVLAEVAVERLRRMESMWKLHVVTTSLVRVKDTRAMYELNPSQRRRNLKGAFRVTDPDAIKGREILLIDDIMTTGATARECARVLKRAGALKVWVATAAKAQPETVNSVTPHPAETFAMWDAPAKADHVVSPSPEKQQRFHQQFMQ